jgi:hypothetical protein
MNSLHPFCREHQLLYYMDKQKISKDAYIIKMYNLPKLLLLLFTSKFKLKNAKFPMNSPIIL